MRRLQLPWNIATRPSLSGKPCARSSSNATCSGRCSTQFITPTSRRSGLQSALRGISAVRRPPLLVKMDATAIPDSARPTLARGVRLQIDSATGKNVLLYPEGIVELNETAHDILSRCDGRTLSEIVQALAEEYEADRVAIAADVHEALADLERRKLIEFT